MLDGRIHPVTLRFASPELEAAFQADHVERSVWLVRASIVLAISQFAVFGLLDPALAPESAAQIRTIRLVMCLVSAGIFAYTFTDGFRRHFQAAMAATGLFGGLAIVAMIPVSGTVAGYYDYYIGLVLVLVYVHVLLRLRFVIATAVGLCVVAAYLAAAFAVETPVAILLNSLLFEISALLAGSFASYSLERYARRTFLQSRRQAETTAQLSDALAELRAAQARLVQEEKMAGLGRIASGLANAIAAPLAAILDDAERLRQPDVDAAAIAGRVGAAARRADTVVRGLSEQARAGRRAPDRVDLGAVLKRHVRDALDGARRRQPDLDWEVRLALDPDVETVAMGQGDLERVLGTLLANAFDASGPGGRRVVVRTGRDGDGRVCIEVEDSGPGVPAAHRDRVFEPFFTTKAAGTGLGLSLAHETVVTGYGGQIDVDDGVGGGALFRIRLPDPAPRAGAPTAEGAGSVAGPRTGSEGTAGPEGVNPAAVREPDGQASVP